MQSKQDIQNAIENNFEELLQWIDQQDEERFAETHESKWSTGQNLSHLIKSVQPLNQGLLAPKEFLKAQFGVANRPSKTYEQLVEKYQSKLGTVPPNLTGTGFDPKVVSNDEKGKMTETYRSEKGKLKECIEQWTEAELDEYIMPHPLLGKVTIREMLYFTAYHNQHHLKIIKNYYS